MRTALQTISEKLHASDGQIPIRDLNRFNDSICARNIRFEFLSQCDSICDSINNFAIRFEKDLYIAASLTEFSNTVPNKGHVDVVMDLMLSVSNVEDQKCENDIEQGVSSNVKNISLSVLGQY